MNKKTWVTICFVVAFTQWFFPTWNGIFFSPSNISTGEGRIIASILFVGGLILWYLPNKKE